MFGYPDRQSLTACKVTDLYSDASERQQRMAELDRYGLVLGFEIRAKRYDGTLFWVKGNAHTIHASDGATMYYEGSLEDITERKQVEQELDRHRHQLESLVEQRTAELVQVNERLQCELTERKQAEALSRIQHELSIALSSTGDLAQASDSILDAAFRIEGLDCGGIYLVDETTGDLELVCHRNLTPEFVAEVARMPADSPQVRPVMAGQPVYHTQADLAHTGHRVSAAGIRTLLAIPVLHEGRVVASLNLASHTHDSISLSTRHTLEAIAARLGGVIARVPSHDRLAEE